MTLAEIRKELSNSNLFIWQLCQRLEISKSTFYKWYHNDFVGHDQDIKGAIADLANSTKEADNR